MFRPYDIRDHDDPMNMRYGKSPSVHFYERGVQGDVGNTFKIRDDAS